MKKIALIAALFAIGCTLARAEVTSTIDIQRGERWWGIFAGDTVPEPFATPFKVNTADLTGSNTVMLSSTGRYISSPEPMEVSFDGRKITVTTDSYKAEAQKGGKTLREAYLVWRHKHNINEGKMPENHNFSSVNYFCDEIWGEKDLREYTSRLKSSGFDSGIVVLPDSWRSVHGYYFDKELYPDVAGIVKEMDDKGYRLRLTLSTKAIPYGAHFREGVRSGMVVKNESTGSYHYDCREYSVVEMISALGRQARAEYGIGSFMLYDRSGDETMSVLLWERYAAELNLPDYMAMYNYRPRLERVGVTVNMLTSAGLVGRTVNSLSPIDFTEEIDAPLTLDQIEAYNRMAVSMPVAQMYIPRRLLDNEEYRQAALKQVAFRGRMVQYILSLVNNARVTAEPMVRHMEYQFPKQGFANCDTQYMLGSKYMFVAVPTGATKVTVRLPKGRWTGFDGRQYKGPLVTEVTVPRGEPVWFEL